MPAGPAGTLKRSRRRPCPTAPQASTVKRRRYLMDENSTLSPAHTDATASSSAATPPVPSVPPALAPFAGLWRGEGEGAYPTIDDFAYTEEIEFAPSGKPFLAYRSRT